MFKKAMWKCAETQVALTTRLRALKNDESGQGTVEYVIIVGVLVVIAMIAIAAFKDKITELWEAVQEGVNGL